MNRYVLTWLVLIVLNPVAHGQWQRQSLDSTASFRGLSVVSSSVAWVSGTQGTFARTTDSGKTWKVGHVAGAEKLDFRDVEAFSGQTAYLLSAGPGEESRIYKTADGGASWELQFKSSEPRSFYDAIAFWDEAHGIALSDPVNGRFPLIVTDDGGAHWRLLPEQSLPQALPKEGCFAASGTCLITRGKSDAWFCTGGGKTARVFHSSDRGRSWMVSDSPLQADIESAGIFSIAFRDSDHGVIVGGNYSKASDTTATVAYTHDGGKTWKLSDNPVAFRSAVAWAHDRWITVGTSGSDYSLDDGATWKPLAAENDNSVAFSTSGAGWAAGPKGRIARYTPPK